MGHDAEISAPRSTAASGPSKEHEAPLALDAEGSDMIIDKEDGAVASYPLRAESRMHTRLEDDDEDLLELASDSESRRLHTTIAGSTELSVPGQRKRKKRISTPSEASAEEDSDEYDELNENDASDPGLPARPAHRPIKLKLSYSQASNTKEKRGSPSARSPSKKAYPKAVQKLAEADERQYLFLKELLTGWLQDPVCGRTAFLTSLNNTVSGWGLGN